MKYIPLEYITIKGIALRGLTLIALLALVSTRPLAAQDEAGQQVTGVVTEEGEGTPIPGVNVVVKGTSIGTATDAEGAYELTVPSPSDTLSFSFVGYQPQEVPIDGRSTIDVALQTQILESEELVVTGYQTQRQADITGSVATVSPAEIDDETSSNVLKSLQGRAPGVTVYTDGSPGAGAQVRIRGVTTLNNNDPLYIIDGVPSKNGAVSTLNPEDIASMQVLKDASSASIYGARASNGVIIITTKNPGEQPLQVQYSADVTASHYASKLDPLSTEERGRVLWQAAINDGRDPTSLPIYSYDWERRPDGTAVLGEVIVPEYVGDPALGIRSANTNWFDEISRTGLTQNHNLSVSTGSEQGGALLSLRYHDDAGIVRETGFRRFSGRINSDYNFFGGRLRVGENLMLSSSENVPLPAGLGGTPLDLALIAQPILPLRTESGGWAGPAGAGFDDRDNPVRLLEHNRWDQNDEFRTFGNVFAELELVSNLTLDATLGVDYLNGGARNIQRTYQSGFLSRDVNSLSMVSSEEINWTLNSTLEYDFLTGNHSTTLLAGVEAVRNAFSFNTTYREQFAIEELDFFVQDAGTGSQVVNGDRGGFSLLSYFGTANYNFGDKYLAAATLRYDGSSRFGLNRQFGLFPSLSLGWRVSEEPFVKENVSFLSDLKLRAGYGITGNQEIANDARFLLYVPSYGEPDGDIAFDPSDGTAYPINGGDSGNLPSGFARRQRANDELQWEETAEINLGIDFGFFDQKLTGSVDYFDRNTTDILINPPYLAAVGEGGAQWANGASVHAYGAEAQLTYEDAVGENLTFALSGNVGASRDEITELPASVVNAYPGNEEKTILGRSQNANFGYVVDGIFESQEEVNAHAEQPGKAVGRLRFADLNGDGAITALDQRYLGVTTPDFSYGLNAQASYKGVDVSLFFQGVYGPEVFNPRKIYTDFTSIWNGANYGSRTLDAWTPENTDTRIPALTLSDDNNEDRSSTYFIEDGSYLKLRTVQLGYTFGARLSEALQAQRLRIYGRAENFLLFSDRNGADAYTAPDPENPGVAYPRPRSFTLGVDLVF